MHILGIETSCDETAACVITGSRGRLKILSHVIASQIKTHAKYGGVVPEVAARQHVTSIIPVIREAMGKARLTPRQIDCLAVTSGPGLVTSLRVGVQTAKTLAYAWEKKLIGINHIEGHLYAPWFAHPGIRFPTLCLVVSGGHTELILMKNHGQYRLIGKTLDDAAGEAFDKVAKLLRLGYPGGPRVQELARQGNPTRWPLPRPMLNRPNYDFSFAGLKTAVLYLTKKEQTKKADVCASFQQAVIDVLVGKTAAAAAAYKVKSVVLAGGVAANQPLRNQLARALRKTVPHAGFFVPPLTLCTDNAAMIAAAGYFRARKRDYSSWKTLTADPNWELVR